MTGDRLEACLDAAALIRATAGGDREGAAVVLANCDARRVCEVLALTVVAACGGHGPHLSLSALIGALRTIDQEGST